VLDENSTIKDFLNIDDREGFESFDLNEKDLFSFSFGRMENKQFLLDTKTSFDEAITYNRTRYQISSNTSFVGGPEYTFNSAMSGKIVKNHAINYILKKNFEIFAGTSLNEARFSYFDRSFINTPTQESESLVNYFNQQDYSDDLKDYLTRTSITSPIINPERYLIPSYGISSFERVFLLPCFKPRPEANFSFKSLIPVVRLL
jgi:phosphatidylserine/phosphatidylglycerophosphate/cardiolipin synthase-like enzyme